jgi:YggT family protein
MNTPDLLIPLLNILLNFIRALEFCIFLAVIFSWFPGSARHPVVQFIRRVAEPILKVARKIMPRTGMIDFSPILAFIALTIIEQLLYAFIQSISA